jgi:lactobin A/cerein 7B family class IIb bacteriocin
LESKPTQARSNIMTTFNIDPAANVRELTAEEIEIVAGGFWPAVWGALTGAKMLADATGSDSFTAAVNGAVQSSTKLW